MYSKLSLVSFTGFLPDSEIDIITPCPQKRIKHVLFDFDGTISLLREGWQHIMQAVCVEEICGDHAPSIEIESRVANFIEETTGEQTIVQMEQLVSMVREAGLVHESQILDAKGYKARYNARLIRPVQERLAQLASGSISEEQFMVAGTKEFLSALGGMDLFLYVFSGTDQADVRNEAKALGVDEYFIEIWGALDSIEAFSKEKTIQTIINNHNLSGNALLAIGDGPVEIRNIKAVGGTAIGVASDEINGGWDEDKRQRLLSAGADILISDFLEAKKLISYLFDSP